LKDQNEVTANSARMKADNCGNCYSKKPFPGGSYESERYSSLILFGFTDREKAIPETPATGSNPVPATSDIKRLQE
jgi:hypothetical protein